MADNSISGKTDQILVEEHSYVRTLILNRPRQLNALSLQMVSHLLELFTIYEEDRNVKLLILKGEGRAFCAGGDVAAVVKDTTDGHWRLGARFFWIEYTLNYIMATYNKPQVSILNGIIFGGGAGASIHGRFRIATENSVFSMPETALGLFPDVGASYFLSRLPGFFGKSVPSLSYLMCLSNSSQPIMFLRNQGSLVPYFQGIDKKFFQEVWLFPSPSLLTRACPLYLKWSLSTIN
uniref:3-hydroxyisobutyryl-CoA hydrolase n=1 Tax=Nelumbo nucifera TaxID=4432 RepID=A0A822XGC4_NELNU|nr:TPA_asm: hypothetical protein HUJ06_019614 [Nelumbo nucifera]